MFSSGGVATLNLHKIETPVEGGLRHTSPTKVKVALVHDWLTGTRGGEYVLEVLCEVFPSADLYTLIHIPGSVPGVVEQRLAKTSFL